MNRSHSSGPSRPLQSTPLEPGRPAHPFWPADHQQVLTRGLALWLDDERPAPPGWICVTTASEAIRVLQSQTIRTISLDHDLGPESAGTGYDVATWLEEQAFRGTLELGLDTRVHSANPVGRARMIAALAQVR